MRVSLAGSRAPTKNGPVTGAQSSAGPGRPPQIPTAEALPPLLERKPLAIVDEAVTFLRTQPATLLGVAFIVLLPLRLIAVLLPGSGLRDARPDQLIDILVESVDATGGVLAAIATLTADSLAVFVVGAIYGKLLASWYSEEAPLVSDLLVWSIKKSPILAVGWILIHIAELFLGVLSLGLGAVVVGTFFMVTAPVLGAEGNGIRKAIARSFTLTAPRFVACISLFAMVGLGGQAMRFVLRTLPTILGLTVIPIPAWIVSGVLDLLAATVTVAFTASAALVLYLDLRVRKEGIDLEVAMARVFPEVESNRWGADDG